MLLTVPLSYASYLAVQLASDTILFVRLQLGRNDPTPYRRFAGLRFDQFQKVGRKMLPPSKNTFLETFLFLYPSRQRKSSIPNLLRYKQRHAMA